MDNTSNTISVNEELQALGIVTPPDTPPELLSGGIVLSRESMLTGQRRERYIPGLTIAMMKAWSIGELTINEAMPDIDDMDRQFIETGIVQSEWGIAFPEFLDDEGIEWDTDDAYSERM